MSRRPPPTLPQMSNKLRSIRDAVLAAVIIVALYLLAIVLAPVAGLVLLFA